MMKSLFKQVICSEKGQALPIVLALMVLGGLTIAPALDYAAANLNSSRSINENVSGLSAGEIYQISPKTGTLERQKGLSFVEPTSGTEAMDAQSNALKDRKPVGIAVSATKLLLTPTE